MTTKSTFCRRVRAWRAPERGVPEKPSEVRSWHPTAKRSLAPSGEREAGAFPGTAEGEGSAPLPTSPFSPQLHSSVSVEGKTPTWSSWAALRLIRSSGLFLNCPVEFWQFRKCAFSPKPGFAPAEIRCL